MLLFCYFSIFLHEYVQCKLRVSDLQAETDILPLMSALLVLIVLLPMIPALIGNHLQDIFEVFRYHTVIILHIGLFSVPLYESGYFLNMKV
jgi:uncharacterized membrane protein